MRPTERLRADLARPDADVPREKRQFLAVGAVVVTVLSQIADPGTASDLAVFAVAPAAFVLCAAVTRLPPLVFAGLVVAPTAYVVGAQGVLEGSLFLSVLMVLVIGGTVGSLVRGVAITLVAFLVPFTVWLVADPPTEPGWDAWGMAHGFTFVMGLFLRRQELLIVELRDAREALARQAVAEERRRIARELHDLAGHTLAAMLLHVTGARHVLRRDVDEAERALTDAEAVGRSSLDQIRATVASLRADEHGADPSLPGAADLVPLAEEYRRVGISVDLEIDDTVADLTGPLGAAVHRIAREALTNVGRHARENRAEVSLTRIPTGEGSGARVRLVVADRGRPAPARSTDGLHFGVVGMGERARGLGGTFSAGPTPDGWRVEATLPLDRAARTHPVPT